MFLASHNKTILEEKEKQMQTNKLKKKKKNQKWKTKHKSEAVPSHHTISYIKQNEKTEQVPLLK